jgi:hypothetical protein
MVKLRVLKGTSPYILLTTLLCKMFGRKAVEEALQIVEQKDLIFISKRFSLYLVGDCHRG